MSSDANDQTLTDYCYNSLKEGIIRGEFAPGMKLRIASLKEQLNVGPTPIREALSRLAFSGLIVAEANRGFFVKSISEVEVRDVYATFITIELLALNQSIDLGDVLWEANVLGALHRLSVIENSSKRIDSVSWLSANYEFHYSLIKACNSLCLLKIRADLYQLFDRYCHLSLLINKDSLQINNKEHEQIAKAAIERDKDKVCRLTTLHLESSLDQVIERLKKIIF